MHQPLPSSRTFARAVAITSLGFLVVQLDVSIVNVALTRIGAALATDLSSLQWTVDGYTLAFAALLMSAGALGDRIGARRVFVGGMALFTAASLGCGLARGPGFLIAARVVQGVGAAMLMPCSLALLSFASGGRGDLKARGVAIWTAAGGAALAAGPVLGGVMVEHLGWQSIFFINIPIGIAAILLALAYLDETAVEKVKAPFDLWGQLLAIAAPLALTAAIIEGGAEGWASPAMMLGLPAAVFALLAFIYVERRHPAPLLPMSLFAEPGFAVANFIGLVFNFTTYGMIFALSFYFQKTLHYSPSLAGLAFMPFLGVIIVANLVSGPVIAAKGVRLPLLGGLLAGVVGFLLLVTIDADTTYADIVWRLVLLLGGTSFAVPAMTTAVLSSAPPGMAGVASGVLNTIRQSAGAIGVAVFGALLSIGIVPGMRIAFGLSAALLGLALVAALIYLPRTGKEPAEA
jgi:DHA2 family methylenomycin A resistance protein-like MFS transporter